MRPNPTRLTAFALAALAFVLVSLPASAGGTAVVITDVTKLEPAVEVGVVNLSLVPRTATVVVEVRTKDGVQQQQGTVSVPPLTKVVVAVAVTSPIESIQQVGISEPSDPM